MKEDGQSTQIYEPPQTVVDHFDSSYQGEHLAFWQQGQRSWKQQRGEKWIQQSCTETSCKEDCGLWCCMVNGLCLYIIPLYCEHWGDTWATVSPAITSHTHTHTCFCLWHSSSGPDNSPWQILTSQLTDWKGIWWYGEMFLRHYSIFLVENYIISTNNKRKGNLIMCRVTVLTMSCGL